jgi:WD40 repeat protein
VTIAHDAFISYSHLVDGRLAPALESCLERLARPPFRLRAMDVFRDQTSLSAGPGVWSGILAHLAGARWFIYLASAKAAASPWCQKELRWWLEERGTAQMLIVLTEGAIEWDDANGDFDWTRTTVLPRADTAGRFSEVPLYVDLRWAREADKVEARDPRLRAACLDLAAPVRGIAKDQLDGDDVRQLRRARALRRAAVSAITVTAGVAIWQAIEANRQRLQAEDERERAVSRQLAAQASEMRVREPVLALLLAAQAQATAPTTEAHATLVRLASTMPLERIVEHDLRFSSLAARAGGTSLFAGDAGGALWRLQLPTGQWSRLYEGAGHVLSGPTAHAVSPDGQTVAFAGYGGTLRLWHAGAIVRTIESPIDKEQIALDVEFSPDGSRLAMAGQTLDGSAGSNGFVVVHDLASGERRFVPGGGAAAKLVFTQDGRRLVIGGDHGQLTVLPLEAGAKATALPTEGGGSVVKLALANRGRHLFVAWLTGQIDVFDLVSKARIDSIPPSAHGLLASMVVVPDGQSLFAGYADGSVARWRRGSAEPTWRMTELYRHAVAVSGLALLDEGSRLVSVDRDGRLYIAHDEGTSSPAHVRWSGSPRLDRAWVDRQAQRIALLTAGRLQWFDPRSTQVEVAAAPPLDVEAARPDPSVLGRNHDLLLRQRGTEVLVEGPGATKATALAVGERAEAATFGADGRTVYTLAKHQVQAWDPSSGSRVGEAVDVGDRASALLASPDGRWLAVLHVAAMQILKLDRSGGAALTLLETPSLKARVRQAGLSSTNLIFPVSAIFVDGGQRLYLVDQMGSRLLVDIWDLRTLRRLDASWQADDGILLGSIDGKEPLWLADLAGGRLLSLDLRPEQLIDWACALAGRAITADEWARLVGVDRPYLPRCGG